MVGTVGKIGGEIKISKRRRAESETDCSSRPRRNSHVRSKVSHGHVADRLMEMGSVKMKKQLAMCLSHRPNSMNLI